MSAAVSRRRVSTGPGTPPLLRWAVCQRLREPAALREQVAAREAVFAATGGYPTSPAERKRQIRGLRWEIIELELRLESVGPDPLYPPLLAWQERRPPPLAWVVEWSAGGTRDPVQAAYAASTSGRLCHVLLTVVGDRRADRERDMEWDANLRAADRVRALAPDAPTIARFLASLDPARGVGPGTTR